MTFGFFFHSFDEFPVFLVCPALAGSVLWQFGKSVFSPWALDAVYLCASLYSLSSFLSQGAMTSFRYRILFPFSISFIPCAFCLLFIEYYIDLLIRRGRAHAVPSVCWVRQSSKNQ
jgi:hypothetical protein